MAMYWLVPVVTTSRWSPRAAPRLVFPAEAAQDVQAFVVEESKCCPFFSFEIDEIDQGLRLGIRTPPGGEAMLEVLQAAFAGNPAKLRAKFETIP